MAEVGGLVSQINRLSIWVHAGDSGVTHRCGAVTPLDLSLVSVKVRGNSGMFVTMITGVGAS